MPSEERTGEEEGEDEEWVDLEMDVTVVEPDHGGFLRKVSKKVKGTVTKPVHALKKKAAKKKA